MHCQSDYDSIFEAGNDYLYSDEIHPAELSSNECDYDSVFEAGDDYTFYGDIVPNELNLPTVTTSELDQDDELAPRLDGKKYTELTKADPHNKTFFYPWDVRNEFWTADFLKLSKERYFKMLGEINRGEKNGPVWENTELKTYQLRRSLVEIFSERLNMTNFQKRQAIARATNVNGKTFGRKLTLLVYCTCAYVVHNDNTTHVTRNRKCHPNTPDDKKDEIFVRVAEEYDLREKDIRSCYGRLEYLFQEELPPVKFDLRKPGWEPGDFPPNTKGVLQGEKPPTNSSKPRGVYIPFSIT